MSLKQQIVQNRIENIAQELNVSEDMAFLRLAHWLITNQSINDFDENDLVDGGQDKQIDVISIVSDENEATVYILQAKNSKSFSSNMLMQMQSGLEWVLTISSKELNGLQNVRLKDQIQEFRVLLREIGTSNIHIFVGFITNGLTEAISDEFTQEKEMIRRKYNDGTFSSFKFESVGASELVDMLNRFEKRGKSIDRDLQTVYDRNQGSLLRHRTKELEGIICTVSTQEIGKIVSDDEDGFIFDTNLRNYLGDRKSINQDIYETCTNFELSPQFWFLNNGITIVCDNFDTPERYVSSILKQLPKKD